MSVVVRMGIPVNCDKCDLRNRCKLYVDYSWSLSDCFPTRPKPNPLDRGCLIVCQLPKGHGNLVDADMPIREIEKYITIWDCHCSEFGNQTVMAVDDLGYLPIVVPAERSETCLD